MQLKLPLGVVEGRVELVRSMDATAIGSHHHVFPRVPKEAHHLMDVWTKFLRIAMRHDFVEDTGSAILHSANDIEPDPAGDTTPGAVRLPRLAFESLWVFALAWTQGTCRHQPARSMAKRHRLVSSSERRMLSPRRAQDARAASSRRAQARSAGLGSSLPVGRQELSAFFFTHNGHFHGPAGHQFGGLKLSPGRANSLASGGSRAQGDRDRQGG
jgi:hypothetical protein